MSRFAFLSTWLTTAPPSVAIALASQRVAVAELATGAGGPSLRAYATEPLDAAALVPALSGVNIPDTAAVADAVRRAFDRAGIRSPRRTALVVPDSVARVALLTFDQLPARPRELDELVRWQLRKATPFPLDEARVAHVLAHRDGPAATFAAVIARKDVLAQYEAVAAAVGVHAGIVDLASLNIVNAVIESGASPAEDSLLVCLTHESITMAILRGPQLMFYRHRPTLDEEPLGALVRQTAMYHEDRLGGSRFARVWLCGGGAAARAEEAGREIGELVGVPVERVDLGPVVGLPASLAADRTALDALVAPIGVLLRERRAA